MTRDSWSPLRWTLICCYAVLYGGGPSVAAANPTVTLIVPKSVPGPAGFGASEIERSLTGRGWQVERSTGSLPSHEPAIVLALWPNQSSTSRKLAPPSLPESYRIVREGRSRIVITGSDATGLMYGALDVSEQLRWSPAKEAPLDSIQARQKSPYLELRGVNQFLHKQAMDNPTSWYYSMTFWQEYLNALARSRHNFLDLHALYDMVTTGFPNLFPHVIHLEEYPQADLGREQTEKNLKVLKTVIVMAADRGIKVGIMNYNAGANVPGDKLADYTSKCVERLLKELPGLWAFGFRIGESGQPEDFFKRSYIAGVENSGVKVNLFTRSWIASRQKIMEIADRHKGRFLVEIKYNGEQLGLPYQVQGERMADWGSYSYQQYTDLPRNYSILWQVRANGTHRIFQWGDPEFARRVARTCRLGDGAGFSLEPISAYYPMEQYYLNPKTFPKPFFRWEFERNWFWYDTWGRTGYDPTVPDSVFENLFSERFGGQAGPSLFKSVVAASKIVPLIYAYHCLGPDHRNMAPEFEIGNDHGGRRNADGSGERVHNGLNGFLNAEPLDDTVMVSPRRYVEEAIKGSPYPPVGPQEVSLVLEDFVNRARQALPKESELPAGAREAYKDASLDVEALSSLAQYYAAKIRAVTCLELYHRTGDLQSLNTSRQLCQKALDSWDELSGHTEEHFSPIIERIRMFTTSFTWREEGKDLSRELDEVNAVWRKAVAPPASPGGAPKLSHTPRQLQDPGKEVKVSLTALSQNATMQPVLHYRSTNGPYSGNAMSPVPEFEHVFEGTMPVESVKDGWIEYYFTASSDGATAILPEAGEGRPYRVTLTRDLTPPSVTSTQSHLTPHRDKVTVNASVRDSSGVGSVDLLYRPMPSFYAWQSVPMRKVGADRYRADAPLTPEGLLYRIVAVDKKGVAAQWPSFLKETPYRCIAPWEPSWITHQSVALREGTPVYAPRVGEKVFADGEGVIKAIPEELTGLTGVRYPERALVRAQAHGYGGFPIPFKVLKETRLFLAFRGDPFPGYGRYAPKALTVGDKQYDIFARDFTLGEHLLVFPRGPIGIVLGFKERTPKDKPLEVPSVRLGGKLVWEVLKRDFVTTSTDFEFYMPKVGALVYTDRQYAIERIPEELQQCLGLRFSNDRAKQGNMSVPFKLEKPAMLYVVFGNADEGAWQRPPRDWKLYAKDAYRHGPTDTLQRSIYCKNNPAGDGVLTLESGTGVILGFK